MLSTRTSTEHTAHARRASPQASREGRTSGSAAGAGRPLAPGSTPFAQRYMGNGHLLAASDRPGPPIQRSCACGGGCGGACAANEDRSPRPGIQPKLRIGAPDDPFEREADRIADLASGLTGTVAERASEGGQAPVPSVTPLRGSGSVPPPVQRARYTPSTLGPVSGCVGRSGDITDVGYRSDDLFLFSVSSDNFEPGERERLEDLALDVGTGDTVDIHGFASEEGPAEFNEHLSCRRAHTARDVLVAAGVAPHQVLTLYKHGATAGYRPDRRSVVVLVSSPAPPEPAPKPEPEEEAPARCTPAYSTAYGPTAANCAAYNDTSARRWFTWTYRNNASCACENTPDDPKNNCVRKCLQVKMSSFLTHMGRSGAVIGSCIDPFGVLDPLCPEPFCKDLYRHHVECYRDCCCDDPFINYPTFWTMCQSPFPCTFVGATIDWFNKCE